jgi:hypothetical protein
VEPDMKAHTRYAQLIGHYTQTYACLKDDSRRLVEAGERSSAPRGREAR